MLRGNMSAQTHGPEPQLGEGSLWVLSPSPQCIYRTRHVRTVHTRLTTVMHATAAPIV